MGERKAIFTGILKSLLDEEIFPSGAQIQARLGRYHKGLNSEQTRWRREFLESRGWSRGDSLRARWKPPE